MRLRNIIILLVILLALGGYFFIFNKPAPVTPPEPQIYVWLVSDEEIQHIEIILPREGKSEAFIKIPEEDKFPWYFDDPQRSEVDSKRWGGGIPLLLSGPGVERIIAKDATAEKLAEFGLNEPQMEIFLTLTNENTINILVGNETPDGNFHYVQAPNTNDVALVDYTWFEVLTRLVKEPPYASSTTD